MILVVANTVVGRPGNIGYRISKVLNLLGPSEYYILARGISGDYRGVSFGVFGLFSRLLNGVRRYWVGSFNSRRWDIYLFNACVMISFLALRRKCSGASTVYLCESSWMLCRFFKARGVRVVLDVPIAPARHACRINTNAGQNILRFNNFLASQEEACYELADLIIAPSDYVGAFIAGLGYGGKVVVRSFGVEAGSAAKDLYEDCRVRSLVRPIRIGFLGNISARKGCVQLLRAWSKSEFGGNAELILQGKVYPEVRNLLQQSGVVVREFGETSAFFRSIDVFFFPSFMEGSAKVVYESVVNGVPVYASRYAGSPLNDGVGISELHDLSVRGLQAQLTEIVSRPPPRLELSYRISFAEKNSWEIYASRILGDLR